MGTIEALAVAIDAKDQTSPHHMFRVRFYASVVARALGMSDAEAQGVELAAMLHDVGKLAIPESVLSKPGPLTPDEFQTVRSHPRIGADIVASIPFPFPVAPLILSHHERWDGSGYPGGLAGDAIPLIARIIAVADAYSAMTTTRPYRRALTRGAALERLTLAAGTQLEPRLVDVFVLAMESQATPPEPSDVRAPTLWLAEGSAA